MRYDSTKISTRFDKKQVYLTTYYPEIAISASDVYIISQIGDRLDGLSFKYYKDAQYWWVIAQANNLGKGSLSIPNGIQLRIPANIGKILTNFSTENSS